MRCDLCPHRCLLPEGVTGRCSARRKVHMVALALNYGRVCVQNVDSIEKELIFHYRPGTMLLSLGTRRFCPTFAHVAIDLRGPRCPRCGSEMPMVLAGNGP